MDVPSFSTASGTIMQQYSCHFDANQLWRFTPAGPPGQAIYQITSRTSGLALDIPGFSSLPGTQLQQFTPNGGTNQQFRAIDAGNGLVRLQAVNSNLCLSVNHSYTCISGRCFDSPDNFNDGQPFRQYVCSTTDWRQQLHIERRGTLTKKALVVVMQNGGYQGGLPFNPQINLGSQPVGLHFSCSGFQVDLGLTATITDAINQLRNHGLPLMCLNPGNWSVTTIMQAVSLSAADVLQRGTSFVPEEIAAGTIHTLADLNYDAVRILQGSDFGLTRLRQELLSLSASYVIDLHVLAHGDASGFGLNDEFNATSIRQLHDIVGLNLRTVYQQNCNASGLNDDFRVAGARVVSGSSGINSMPIAYGFFLRRWVAGETFAGAVSHSYDDVAPMYGVAYHFVDLYDEGAQQSRDPGQYSVTGNLSPDDELLNSVQLLDGDGSITKNQL